MIFIKLLLKKLVLISLVFITFIQVIAKDGGSKESNTKTKKENQIEKNKTGDISYEATNYESEEAMASWYIEQSIPKTEKISKKEEKEQRKASHKIIKREKKACKKLQKSIQKKNCNSE